jgi:hypothetical protein
VPPRFIALNNSGLGCGLTLLGLGLLLGAVGLGWVVNSILLFFFFLALAPVVLIFLLRWWVGRNLLAAPCPVCGYELSGLRGQETVCPSCGEALAGTARGFERVAPPGTIEVEAVEVNQP